MPHVWEPDHYLTYADQRGRPFAELVTRIDADAPRTVMDLGCGPGNLTATLADRWPDARIAGLDSSPEMVAAARERHPTLDVGVGDLATYLGSGAAPVDVLVSNAALQWVPGHLDLLPALVDHVRPGGWLAFQVPGNFDEPSHTIRRDLAAEPPYAAITADLAGPASHDPAVYLGALARLGCLVDAWETTYLHLLDGPDPVFTWVSGTGAAPTLAALREASSELHAAYVEEFKRRLDAAYPATAAGVVLAFRRIFVVAQMSR